MTDLTYKELFAFPDHYRKHDAWLNEENEPIYKMELVNISLRDGVIWKKKVKVSVNLLNIDAGNVLLADYINMPVINCRGDKCRRDVTPEDNGVWCEACHGDLEDRMNELYLWLKEPYDIDLTNCEYGIIDIVLEEAEVKSFSKLAKLFEKINEEEKYVQNNLNNAEQRVSILLRKIEAQTLNISRDRQKLLRIQEINDVTERFQKSLNLINNFKEEVEPLIKKL